MRKIFSAIVVFLVLFGVHRETLAQTSSLEAFAVGENISISYTSTNSAVVQPMISDKEISAIPPSLVIAPGLEPKLSGLSQKTSWQTKKTLDPAIVYYVRIFDTSSKVFLTENIKINTEYSTISLGNFNLEKQNTGTYGFYGNIDIKKHAENSLVPYSSIKVSGDITTKKTGEKIMGLGNPVTVDEKGEYRFLVINNSFDPNGWYLANLTFESDKGVSTTKSYDFNIKKGVIPETGKEADNFYDSNSYRLLAPIPGMTALLDPELCKLRQQSNPGEICDINAFLNFILKLIIGIAAVILVVRIIITGYGYMLTDVPFVKAKLKGGFRDALLGLIFALASYVILNTINPRLVNNDFSIGVAEFDVEEYPGDNDAYVPANYTQIQGTGVAGYNFDKAVFPNGVICPKSGGKAKIREIAASWQGKATYSQIKRGTPGPNGTQYLDCSSYVTTVLLCAGIQPATYATTQAMFEGKAGSEKFSKSEVIESPGKIFIKGKELQPGDLLGWRNGSKGHVVIYVGGGKFRESQVGGYVTKKPILGETGNSVQGEKSFSYYGGQLEYLRRITP